MNGKARLPAGNTQLALDCCSSADGVLFCRSVCRGSGALSAFKVSIWVSASLANSILLLASKWPGHLPRRWCSTQWSKVRRQHPWHSRWDWDTVQLHAGRRAGQPWGSTCPGCFNVVKNMPTKKVYNERVLQAPSPAGRVAQQAL